MFPATDEFIQGIRKFCDEKGILMLLDEVQAGWGRCGDFMCYMTYGIKPDVVSMAKAMGGGMPSAASPAPTVSPLLSAPAPTVPPMLATPSAAPLPWLFCVS